MRAWRYYLCGFFQSNSLRLSSQCLWVPLLAIMWMYLCIHLEVWNLLLCNAIEYGVLVKIVQCVKCYCVYKCHTPFMALMITFEWELEITGLIGIPEQNLCKSWCLWGFFDAESLWLGSLCLICGCIILLWLLNFNIHSLVWKYIATVLANSRHVSGELWWLVWCVLVSAAKCGFVQSLNLNTLSKSMLSHWL